MIVVLLFVGCLRGDPVVPTGTVEPGPTDSSTSVVCPTGFERVGPDCVDIDECADKPCSPQATCANTEGAFECTCTAGYTGDGFDCADTDGCADDPCAAGGDVDAVCEDVPAPGDGHLCTCSNAFVDVDDACEACEATIDRPSRGSPTLVCKGAGDCSGQTVRCPSNAKCYVACEGSDTCRDLMVDCSDNSGVDCLVRCDSSDACTGMEVLGNGANVWVECRDSDACDTVSVACPSGGDCLMTCAAADSCPRAMVTCADGPCQLDCVGGGCDGTEIACGSGGCSVTGDGLGDATRTCPEAGCQCF